MTNPTNADKARACAAAIGYVLMQPDDIRIKNIWHTPGSLWVSPWGAPAWFYKNGTVEGGYDHWQFFCWDSTFLQSYAPYSNGRQALELVHKLELGLEPPHGSAVGWQVTCQRVLFNGGWLDDVASATDPNLNKAIVECVFAIPKEYLYQKDIKTHPESERHK